VASPTSSRRTRDRRVFPARTGVAKVVGVRRLSPAMVRITLGGPALRGFFVEEPGEIVTLLWPAPGAGLVLPEGGWRFPPGVAGAQHARNYTVRAWDPETRALDVDFVLHGDHGLAPRWAAGVRAGDTVGFAGPRTHWTAAPRADWSLLVADATGLPALAAIVETLPAGHRAIALVEVADAAEEQAFDSAADLDVWWLHRSGDAPGTTRLLAETVEALALPIGDGRAWGGGEALQMRDVRRHVREARGLSAEAVSILGYWKHRDTESWE
jgi:NADPH-dependent ferric siderophore reductase